MTQKWQPRRPMRGAGSTAIALWASVFLTIGAVWAAVDPPAARQAAGRQDKEAAALIDYKKRLDAYLDLRESLADKLKPLRPTPDAAELATRQDALAAAIKSARKNAKPGDVIIPPIAQRIRAIVLEDFKTRQPDARRAAYEEVPNGVTMTINRTYPKNAALPTVPPLLLNKLPALPDNLQYRFANRHLVLLDGDTQLIVDFVTNVLPAR